MEKPSPMDIEPMDKDDAHYNDAGDNDVENPHSNKQTPIDSNFNGMNSCDIQLQENRPHGLLWLACCFSDLRDRKTCLIIITSMFYFLSVGIAIVPLKLLINKRIAGDANEPNSDSAFVDATNIFLYSLMSFLCGRYNSGLSDYIGRKPMLISALAFLILTRIIYINSTSAAGFYIGAIVGGAFDSFYYTGLSWVCDYYPNPIERNKRVGIYMGVVLGLSLTISAPLGAVLATNISLVFPLIISPLLAAFGILLLAIIPVDDTLGVRKDPDSEIFLLFGKRGVPRKVWAYLLHHFPISSGSFEIMQSASKTPLDWATNFVMHTVPALFSLIMVQFCLAVFHWSPTVASIAVFSIGLTLGIFGPINLTLFNPIPLAFYAMCIFTIGLVLMSIAGAGIAVAPLIGIPGIACIALGTSWIPSLQTNLTNQYGPDVQGVVCGLLGQLKDLAVLPGWLMSLGFSFALRRRGDVYWPGSSMFMAACMGAIAIALHCFIHGREAVVLTWRRPGRPGDVDIDLNKHRQATMHENNPAAAEPLHNDHLHDKHSHGDQEPAQEQEQEQEHGIATKKVPVEPW